MSVRINILVGGEKGGTGKSTIATNLATIFTIGGFQTYLVDCDKQKTSMKYCNRRGTNEIKPHVICTHFSGEQMQIPLSDLSTKYEVVIVDCGGQDSVELRSAMISPSISLMIIPIQAGYFDLETLVNINDLVKQSKIYNPNLVAKCIINRAPTNSLVTVASEAAEFIKNELDNLDLMNTIVHDRVSYSYAAANGQCVIEFEEENKRDKKATKEMTDLFTEIKEIFISKKKEAA